MGALTVMFLVLGLALFVNGQDCQNGIPTTDGNCECLVGSTGPLCEKRSADFCTLAYEIGPCRAAIPRFFYDNSTGTCEEFLYGGCPGNEANNFETKKECEVVAARLCTDSFCTLSPEAGPCEALISRYYHDAADQTCKEFDYGGCEGNANNFETMEECDNRARAVCKPKPQPNAFCDQESETGRCRARIPRFYYDKSSQSCQEFVFGGCGGNDNNFETQEECNMRAESFCPSKFCNLDIDYGRCRAHVVKWFFNSTAGSCQKFVYGGCEGNSNSFMSESECTTMCLPQKKGVLQTDPSGSGSVKAGMLAVLTSVMLSLIARKL